VKNVCIHNTSVDPKDWNETYKHVFGERIFWHRVESPVLVTWAHYCSLCKDVMLAHHRRFLTKQVAPPKEILAEMNEKKISLLEEISTLQLQLLVQYKNLDALNNEIKRVGPKTVIRERKELVLIDSMAESEKKKLRREIMELKLAIEKQELFEKETVEEKYVEEEVEANELDELNEEDDETETA
jgi:thiol-disulfide isomerase/thioredoxin